MRIPTFILKDRATIIPFKGSGAYGPIYDEGNAQKNVRCLIDHKIRTLRSSNGTDVVQRAVGVFPPEVKINQGDKVIDQTTGSEYTVDELVAVNVMGPHSIEAVMT